MMFIKTLEDLIGTVYGEPVRSELEYRRVYNYLDKYTKKLNVEFKYDAQQHIKVNRTIWVCWLQGMENAPELVKMCYESVVRNKPEGYEVILITQENILEYIQLPTYIWEKYEKGIITKTHFSDILRVELLYAYGGCWIDATVYCSTNIPTYMVSGDMFIFKWSLMDQSTLSISSWWIYAKKGNEIIKELRKMIYNYWEVEKKLRNYFLFHIMFKKIVQSNSFNKSSFDSILYVNNSNPHILSRKMELAFDEEEWEIIRTQSPVHKLTYKHNVLQGDIYNYYMALMDNRLI